MELLYVVLLILVLIWLQRLLYEKRSFRRFDYTCTFSTNEAMEGDEIRLVETVTNRKAMPLPWLRSELVTSQWLDYAGSQSLVTDDTRFVTSFFSLRGWQRTTRRWNVRCMKRGVFPVQKCVLLTTDLMGLMSKSQPVETRAELLVLPKPAELTETLTSARKLQGDVIVRRHYLEDPFSTAGVREMTPRDPLSRIHWPSTVRQGRLMVRNTQCTADQNLLILLNLQSHYYDISGVSDPGRVEDCIRICAGYLEDTLRSGLPVRLACNASLSGTDANVVSGEFAGQEHVLDLSRTLARLPMAFTEPFDAFLEGTAGRLEASDIVLITGYLSDAMYAFSRERREKGVRVKLVSAVAVDEASIPADCDVFHVQKVGEA